MLTNSILYISNILPAQSETFVYREIFALRTCGIKICTASVHKGEKHLGSPELDDLAAATIAVYGSEFVQLTLDAFLESTCHPFRTINTIGLAFRDAICSTDLPGLRRVKVLFQAYSALALACRIRPLGIVHIHAHMAHVPTTIAMYAAKQLSISFSFTGHANDLFPNRSLLKEKIQRSLFVSCISRWHRDFYSSIFPRDEKRLPIIHCGVDTNKETFVPVVHNEVLKILSVGRLVPKKGFDVLIEAIGIIAQREKVKVELTLVGAGPEEIRLRTLVSNLPPSAKVIMLGSLDNNHVMELMVQCELFALPLRITSDGDRDGIPVVLMEAMARGRCVISGDLLTIRELISHDSSGFLIPTGDVQALVNIIETLAADRTRLDLVGIAARERIVAEFDVSTNARSLLHSMRDIGIVI